MKYSANVRVTLKEGVLDPEAKTIERSLDRLGFEVSDFRTVEEYEFTVDAEDRDAAEDDVEEMCERLLANPVIHDYTIEVESQ